MNKYKNYDSEKVIEANKDTIIYWLENDGAWLKEILGIHRADAFINGMAKEIEGYQCFMYTKGYEDGKKNNN